MPHHVTHMYLTQWQSWSSQWSALWNAQGDAHTPRAAPLCALRLCVLDSLWQRTCVHVHARHAHTHSSSSLLSDLPADTPCAARPSNLPGRTQTANPQLHGASGAPWYIVLMVHECSGLANPLLGSRVSSAQPCTQRRDGRRDRRRAATGAASRRCGCGLRVGCNPCPHPPASASPILSASRPCNADSAQARCRGAPGGPGRGP